MYIENNAWKIIKTEKHHEHGVYILCKYCQTTKSMMTEIYCKLACRILHCCVRRVKNKIEPANKVIHLHAISSVCFNDGVYN